jgi:hypothetical protein
MREIDQREKQKIQRNRERNRLLPIEVAIFFEESEGGSFHSFAVGLYSLPLRPFLPFVGARGGLARGGGVPEPVLLRRGALRSCSPVRKCTDMRGCVDTQRHTHTEREREREDVDRRESEGEYKGKSAQGVRASQANVPHPNRCL